MTLDARGWRARKRSKCLTVDIVAPTADLAIAKRLIRAELERRKNAPAPAAPRTTRRVGSARAAPTPGSLRALTDIYLQTPKVTPCPAPSAAALPIVGVIISLPCSGLSKIRTVISGASYFTILTPVYSSITYFMLPHDAKRRQASSGMMGFMMDLGEEFKHQPGDLAWFILVGKGDADDFISYAGHVLGFNPSGSCNTSSLRQFH